MITSIKGTALLIIDLMERVVAQCCCPHDAADVVDRAIVLADSLRNAGGTVVWIRTERPGAATQPSGSGLVRRIEPDPAHDILAVKTAWGAFHTTGLDRALRRRQISRIWLAGIATNFGVESTARCADELGYQLTFVEDAMTGLKPGDHEFAVTTIFPHLGHITTHRELLQLAFRHAGPGITPGAGTRLDP